MADPSASKTAGRPDASPPDGGACSRLRRQRRRFTPQRLALTCFKFVGALITLAAIGAGIFVARMEQGPIKIDGLGDKIAAALQERFGQDAHFAVGETSLVQRGFGPSLMIDRLSISGPDGASVFSAPKAEVSVDPLALLFGRVVPKRLEVFDVTLRLALLKNGHLAVAAGEGAKPFFEMGATADNKAASVPPSETSPAPSDPAEPPPQSHRAVAVKQVGAAIRQFLDVLTNPHSAIAAIDRLGVARGKLVIQDEETSQEIVYKDLDLSFDKARGKTAFAVSAEGPSGRWSVSALAAGRPGAEREFSLRADRLSVDELQLLTGSRSLGMETDMPFAVSMDIGLKADDTLREAVGGFKIGPGFLRLDDPDWDPDFIDTIDGGFHWNGKDRRIEIDKTRYIEGGTHFAIAGAITPPVEEGQPWSIKVATTEPGAFGPDRKGQAPVAIPEGSFEGRLQLDRKTFLIDRFAVRGDPGGYAMTGAVDWVSGPHIRFGATIDPTPVATVQRVWPAAVASPVRAWVVSRFEGGMVTSGTLKVDYDQAALARMHADRAPPDKAVALDFVVSKAKLRFLDGVPDLDDIEGHGHITGRTSHFYLTSGTIDADGRKVGVTDGLFIVPNANVHPTPASLTAHVAGTVEAVTNLLARDALRPYASIPLDPSTLHGNVDGQLSKTLLLGPKQSSASQPLAVTARISDFVAQGLIGKESLEDANLTIAVGDGTLKANGQGRLFGGPATFDISRAAEGPPTAVIAVTLDDAARAKLGLAVVPGVSGPMTAHVNASLGDPSKIKAQVDLDLTRTAIAAAVLGLNKPAGRPAKVTFTVQPGDDRMLIEPIAIDCMNVQGRGAIELAADNTFRSAHFSALRISPGDDLKLDVSRGDLGKGNSGKGNSGKGNDTFKLTIRGSTIDARPFLKALTTTPANEPPTLIRNAKAEKAEVDAFKGFDIDLKAGILTGFNKEAMSGVDLKLSKRGSQIRQLSVQGRFGRDPVSASMDSRGHIQVASRDAGALVSFVDLYKHMEGGDLTADMAIGDSTLTGHLDIDNFVLRDEPAMRRLVAQTEDTTTPGIDPEAARRINAGAVSFQRLKVDFDRAGSRLELHDATMYGPQIGLSVDGWLDYSHDRVSMKGTFVPAFALNNLASQVPVFGALLGGKSNEGLLAITFHIVGAVSSPTLLINPLSPFTLGFLRQIFGGIDPSVQVPAGETAEPLR